MNVEAPWKSLQRMDKQALQIVGSVLLIAGLVFGSIGVHKIATNLPISDEEALAESRRAVLPEKGDKASQRGNSLRGKVEFQVWESALQVENTNRTEKRSEGSVFLVLGIISVIWGMALLHNSRGIPDKA